jgi:hypothetical protein
VLFVVDQTPVGALGPGAADEAFRERVRPRRARWSLDHLDALGAEHRVEGPGELGVPVRQRAGIALGIAFLGNVSTAVYRGQSVDGIPASIPVEAAAAARGCGPLPLPRLSARRCSTSREAFASGLHTVAVVSAALMFGVAISS